MELHPRRSADVVVLQPKGRIDYSNADAFAQALAPHLETCGAGKDALLLDFSALEYLSSAVLRVLMLASRKLKSANGRMVIAAPQKVVGEILEISRFQHVLPIYVTVADGLTALSAAKGA